MSFHHNHRRVHKDILARYTLPRLPFAESDAGTVERVRAPDVIDIRAKLRRGHTHCFCTNKQFQHQVFVCLKKTCSSADLAQVRPVRSRRRSTRLGLQIS
ncbi:hypothetical protein C8Q80DRAFT_176037 [Daedaleopsis nitida]|nr:hypothetical protein C8Q80DRAFT_176037 [Daedaleopsis nitida]